jgi:16S rRNA (adenine1518-N6/adenine1519-N6)-dimethyltransferase
MFQREVAERLEHPGTRVGGPMGLLAQSVYHVQAIADVPPDAFRPPPKVWSRVLRFTHRPDALTPERIPGAWRVLQALFRRRRARLDRAVQHWTGKSRDVVQSWFSAAKIRPDARPDHMSLDGFRVLLDYVEGRRS